MRSRCYNKKNKKYKDYGGRGITVCDRWLENFENFLADMGIKPDGMTIDRIDNNGNYIIVEWQGRRMILEEAIKIAGLPSKSVHRRLKRGWDLERSLTTPLA